MKFLEFLTEQPRNTQQTQALSSHTACKHKDVEACMGNIQDMFDYTEEDDIHSEYLKTITK